MIALAPQAAAREACAHIRRVNFAPSRVAFDAAFARD